MHMCVMCMRVRSFARRHILESPTQMTRCSGATCMRDDLPSCATFSCGASGMKGALCIRMPCIGGWGVLNREIVSFRSRVRVYARSGCLMELDLNVCWLLFSLFPFPFWSRGAFPFPFWSWGAFPFPFPPPPKPPIQL